jgi:hypothetical protein
MKHFRSTKKTTSELIVDKVLKISDLEMCIYESNSSDLFNFCCHPSGQPLLMQQQATGQKTKMTTSNPDKFHLIFIYKFYSKFHIHELDLTLILTAWEFQKAFFVKMKISPRWLKQNIKKNASQNLNNLFCYIKNVIFSMLFMII